MKHKTSFTDGEFILFVLICAIICFIVGFLIGKVPNADSMTQSEQVTIDSDIIDMTAAVSSTPIVEILYGSGNYGNVSNFVFVKFKWSDAVYIIYNGQSITPLIDSDGYPVTVNELGTGW